MTKTNSFVRRPLPSHRSSIGRRFLSILYQFKVLQHQKQLQRKQQNISHVKAGNRHFERSYALGYMAKMTDLEFRRMFRVTREAFATLLAIVFEGVEFNTQKAINSSGSPISKVARLGATLRWIAGGSYLDICAFYGLSISNFFKEQYVLWSTLRLIDEKLKIHFSFQPDDLRATADGFAKYSYERMNECVMAVDGLAIETRQPTKKDVGGSVMAYRNRKSMWALLVLAGCNAKLQFTMFSVKCSGGTNDILAWEYCGFKAQLDQGMLPPPYYIIGDEAFQCTQQFLVPFSQPKLYSKEDSFNFHLSSMRQCIERAFGVMTKRWGILMRPLQVKFVEWSRVITICAKLHNFCVEHNIEVPDMDHVNNSREKYIDDTMEEIPPPIIRWDYNINGNLQFLGTQGALGSRRRDIAQELENGGFTRPVRNH